MITYEQRHTDAALSNWHRKLNIKFILTKVHLVYFLLTSKSSIWTAVIESKKNTGKYIQVRPESHDQEKTLSMMIIVLLLGKL